jgi:hypothetical protein
VSEGKFFTIGTPTGSSPDLGGLRVLEGDVQDVIEEALIAGLDGDGVGLPKGGTGSTT